MITGILKNATQVESQGVRMKAVRLAASFLIAGSWLFLSAWRRETRISPHQRSKGHSLGKSLSPCPENAAGYV